MVEDKIRVKKYSKTGTKMAIKIMQKFAFGNNILQSSFIVKGFEVIKLTYLDAMNLYFAILL